MEQSGADTGDKDLSSQDEGAEERLKKKLDQLTPEVETSEQGAADEVAREEAKSEGARGEVSAATLARMMGLATATEVNLLEGKIDLLSTRVNGVAVRMDKILNAISKLPNASDIDRVDINIGSLKTMIRETVDKLASLSDIETGKDKSLENVTIMTSDISDASETENDE